VHDVSAYLNIPCAFRYIHSMHLVHMDIKPGNIFISRNRRLHALNYDSADDGFEEDDPVSIEEEITYKIGNFCMCAVYINPLC
jgi:wee1-like protein kinase